MCSIHCEHCGKRIQGKPARECGSDDDAAFFCSQLCWDKYFNSPELKKIEVSIRNWKPSWERDPFDL